MGVRGFSLVKNFFQPQNKQNLSIYQIFYNRKWPNFYRSPFPQTLGGNESKYLQVMDPRPWRLKTCLAFQKVADFGGNPLSFQPNIRFGW